MKVGEVWMKVDEVWMKVDEGVEFTVSAYITGGMEIIYPCNFVISFTPHILNII